MEDFPQIFGLFLDTVFRCSAPLKVDSIHQEICFVYSRNSSVQAVLV